jgi:hypothetical protein
MKIHSFLVVGVSGVKNFKYVCFDFFVVSKVSSVWVRGSYGF